MSTNEVEKCLNLVANSCGDCATTFEPKENRKLSLNSIHHFATNYQLRLLPDLGRTLMNWNNSPSSCCILKNDLQNNDDQSTSLLQLARILFSTWYCQHSVDFSHYGNRISFDSHEFWYRIPAC